MDMLNHKSVYLKSLEEGLTGSAYSTLPPTTTFSSPYFVDLNNAYNIGQFAYDIGRVVSANCGGTGGGGTGGTVPPHNHDNLYAPKIHDHNDLYYTKTEEEAWRNRLIYGDLLYNKINANHIQAGSITAGSAIVADGAIGSAQISSLSVDKLEAGIIDTAKFTVQGTNGHLKIVDNKLQINERTGATYYERIALGDIHGDGSVYGLVVRGKDGQTVLYDENGVYHAGITDGAITDVKVGDNANIHGTKLNIQSVIEGINDDNTTVIKGLKVDINGESINTVINQITLKQDEHTESINRQQSEINQNKDEIALKVSNQQYVQDITDMTTRLDKTEADIVVLNEGIKLSATKTEVQNQITEVKDFVSSEIDGISIGGTNYLYNTAPFKAVADTSIPWDTSLNGTHKLLYWEDYNANVPNPQVGYHPHVDLQTFKFPCFAFINRNNTFNMPNRELSLKQEVNEPIKYLVPDEDYIISFDAYTDTGGFSFKGGLYHNVAESGDYDYNSGRMDIVVEDTNINTWKRYNYVFKIHKGINFTDPIYFIIYAHNNPEGSAYVKNIKLERGNKPTQWSPSQHDIDVDTDAIIQGAKDYTNQIIKEYSSNVDVMFDGINLRVDSTERELGSVKQNVSEISQKADSLTLSVSDLDGKYTEIKQKVDGIDITGMVTFYDLKTEGFSQINGGNIITDTLSVNSIKSNNEQPILKLFPQDDGNYCSLDATRRFETGGKGDWIRLKWNSKNYWYVGENSAGVYLNNSTDETNGEYATKFWVSTTHARFCLNKLMIGSDNCRIDTTGGAIRIYTTPDGGEDRGIRINNNSGRLEIGENVVGFTQVTSSNGAGVYKNLAFADHTHSNYAPTNHTHDRITNGGGYGVEAYNGYVYFRAGSSTIRLDNGTTDTANFGGAYKLVPTASGIDLGSPTNTWTRWRTIYSQNALNVSDVKSKEDICYLDDSISTFGRSNTPFLDFIKNDFRPATYKYKIAREEEGRRIGDEQIGFIANDIIDSDVGSTFLYNFGTEEDTNIMYSPTGYTTVVAKALQEEIKKREELEQRIEQLEQLLKKGD